jgi:hypothetical protein
MELTGGCLCNAVRYRIPEAPVTTRVLVSDVPDNRRREWNG